LEREKEMNETDKNKKGGERKKERRKVKG